MAEIEEHQARECIEAELRVAEQQRSAAIQHVDTADEGTIEETSVPTTRRVEEIVVA